MIDMKLLWLNRLKAFWLDAGRYLRIIVTGYAYLPILLLLTLGMGYKYLLQRVPASSDSIGLFLAFFWTLLLTRGSIRTFLKHPDFIFLLPVEARMKVYFHYCFWYSFIIQSFMITIFFFLIGPLYRLRISDRPWELSILFFVLLLLKGWNLFVDWDGKKLVDHMERRILFVLRMILNGWWSLYWFEIIDTNVWLILGATLFLSWFISIRTSGNSYAWLELIMEEEHHRSRIYSFVQWFVDTPSVERRVNLRWIFTYCLKWIPYKPSWIYVYLSLRSFVRYNDLFYGYLRFISLSIVCLAFIHQVYLSMFVFVLFLFLDLFHLANGWRGIRVRFWVHILPVPYDVIRASFGRSIGLFLFVHGVFMAVVLFFQYSAYTIFLFTSLSGVLVGFIMQLLLAKRIR